MVASILAKGALRSLLMAVIATVAAIGAAPGVSAALAINCSDVLVLGARGSGQEAAGTAGDGGSGMGPQVYAAYQRLVDDLPGRSVTGVAVHYPARGVEAIALDPAAYFSGLESGVRSVRGTLRQQAAACPDQRFVLVGYSQGAMVMHRVAQDLLSSGRAPARRVLSRIDGVLLIADGDRRAGDSTTDLGTARRGSGVSYVDPATSGVRMHSFPQGWRSRVVSVCNQADIICDYHGLLQADASGTSGVTVHATSYTGSAAVQQAADRIAARLR